MSEISMYEAQKKKMQGLCDEHDLVYRFEKDRYSCLSCGAPVDLAYNKKARAYQTVR